MVIENHILSFLKECNYIGHLASEPEACLALTGCPGLDDYVELTILSEHFPGIFKWYKDGRVENGKTPHVCIESISNSLIFLIRINK